MAVLRSLARLTGTALACLLLIVTSWLVDVRTAGATSYNPIVIDGVCGDWAADERFPGTDAGTGVWVTWDAATVYVAWNGGGGANEKRIAGFDLDPGVSNPSVDYSGATFPASGHPDYMIEWLNGTYYFSQRIGGGWSTSSPGTITASGLNTCAGSNFVELAIPRALFTGGDVAGLAFNDDMRLYGYFVSPTNYVYGSVPAAPANPASGFAPYNFRSALYAEHTGPGAAITSFMRPSVSYTVDSPNDDGDMTIDGGCATINEECTLRAALQEGESDGVLSIIGFGIAGGGVQRIQPGTALIANQSVVIDGLTQPGASCAAWPPTLLIELNGALVTTAGAMSMLDIRGANSVVRGLVINGLDQPSDAGNIDYGLNVTGDGSRVQCNFISTDPTGMMSMTSDSGISIDGTGIVVGVDGDGINDDRERNLISGNSSLNPGWGLVARGDQLRIAGNYVGLNATGTAPLRNLLGIFAFGTDIGTVIGTNSDGISDELERNIISGNNTGISVAYSSNGRISGNYIGTNPTGLSAISNTSNGMILGSNSQNWFIGTNGDGIRDGIEGNIIAGNTGGCVTGIALNTSVSPSLPSANTVIAGNRIGINASGAALGNCIGISVGNYAVDTRIGTNGDGISDELERNIISSNTSYGLSLAGQPEFYGQFGTHVAGNYFGVGVDGTTNRANLGSAIYMQYRVQDVTIGVDGDGSAGEANEGNIIANSGTSCNSSYGIRIRGLGYDQTRGIKIAGNLIGLTASGANAGNIGGGISIESGSNNLLIGTDSDGVSDALERNIIGGHTRQDTGCFPASYRAGIIIDGGTSGIERTNSVTISNNYLGVDPSGTLARSNGTAIIVRNEADSVVIGTDGDGTNDAAEGNLIGFNTISGIDIENISDVTIAGNRIGAGLANEPMSNVRGIYARGPSLSLRIGTNDDGVSDSLERNLIGFNTSGGILLQSGSGATIAGNAIGLDPATNTPMGNGPEGITIQDFANVIVGGAPSRANRIAHHTQIGLHSLNSRSITISHNRVDANTTGIRITNDQDPPGETPSATVIRYNTVENNDYGIVTAHASPFIEDNQIRDQRNDGILNTVPSAVDPATAASQTLARPTIFGNIFENNCTAPVSDCASISSIDTMPLYETTLESGNTLTSVASGSNHVRQVWYGTVEIIDNGTPVAGTATITASNGGPTYTFDESVSCGPPLNTTIHAINPGVSCANNTTWARIVDYVVDSSGTRINYNPYTDGTTTYSFDGDATTDPADTGAGFVGEGLATGSLSRFQVMELELPPANADLAISKTDSADPIIVGQSVDYTITLDNNGPDTVFTATITDTLPPELAFQSASFPRGTCTNIGNTVTCTFDESGGGPGLAADESLTLTITAQAVSVGVAENTVIVAGAAIDPNTANNSATEQTFIDELAIAIFDASTIEGTGGSTPLAFDLELNAAVPFTVTVEVSSTNLTAIAPADYAALNTLVTFAPGQTMQTVTVAVVADNLDEADEEFELALANPSGGAIVNSDFADAVGTIIDDDNAPAVGFAAASYEALEGNAGTSVMSATVLLSTASGQPVTVEVSSTNLIATAPSDYAALNTLITFAPGETTKTVSATINGDTLYEGDEDFRLTLRNPTNASLAPLVSSTSMIILNDDAPPVVALDRVDYETDEGDVGPTSVPITLTLLTPSGEPVSVQVTSSNGTATAPGDYAALSTLVTFAPGETIKTVTLTVNGETLYEADETLTLALSSATGATIDPEFDVATVTIFNDDTAPTLGFEGAAYSTAEGNAGTTPLGVALVLDTPSGQPVSVQVSSTDGTAIAPGDYAALNTLVTFAPGQTTRVVTLTVNGDTLYEPDEDLTLTLSAPTGATLDPEADEALAMIENDDALPVLAFDSASFAALEGDAGPTLAPITLTLSAASSQQVTAVVTSSDATATAPGDYTTLSTLVTFAPGETTKTVTLTINGDTLYEADEDLNLGLIQVAGAVVDPEFGTATFTILNDDALPVVAFDAMDYETDEGDVGPTSVPVTLTLSTPSTQSVSVQVTSANGTATAPGDYAALNTLVTFAPGETTRVVTLTVNGETLFEADEDLTLALSSATGATIDPEFDTATVTIFNDDAAPLIGFEGAAYSTAEGNAGTTPLGVALVLDTPSGQPVSVQVSSTDGTAIAPGDYAALNTLVTFAPGETTKTVTLTINGDTLYEPDEDLTLTLSAPTGATLDPEADEALAMIENDDALPVLAFESASFAALEGDAGPTLAPITLTLSAASSQQVTAVVTSSDATATAPGDYTTLSTLVTFAPGETTKTVTLTINGDTLYEADEDLNLGLIQVAGAAVDPEFGTATFTILNDDALPVVAFDAMDYETDEGDVGPTSVPVTLTLFTPSGQPVSVQVTSSNGTATAPGDYAALNTLVTFAPGETTRVVTLTVNGETLFEADEDLTLALSSATGATIDPEFDVATVTIFNDDDAPLIGFESTTYAALEGDAGPTLAPITLTLSAASSQQVTAVVTSSDATATAPGDYTTLSTLVTFAPGETTKTVTLTINGDTLYEPNEDLNLGLTQVAGAAVDPEFGTATFTIFNDDEQPTVGFNSPGYSLLEGDAGPTTASFVLTLSAPSSQPITVVMTSSDGTATAPEDYLDVNTLVTFAPGETTKTVTATVNGDLILEPNETFVIALSTPNGAILDPDFDLATVTIFNDDALPVVGFESATYATLEGDAGPTLLAITVTMSAPSSQQVPAVVLSSDGTATSPDDYAPLNAPFTFAPGETTRVVTLTVNGDTLFEADEDLTLSLVQVTGATVDPEFGTATVTIRNDDTAPPSQYQVFLPLVLKSGQADLIGSFSLSPDKSVYTAGEPVTVTAIVTNTGTAPTTSFWVDFYINPTERPSVNREWYSICAPETCYGLAWNVVEPLAPGASITLTSTMPSYSPRHSIWDGWLPAGTTDLYLLVDSWNNVTTPIATGAVAESNEANNLTERHGLTVSGTNPSPPAPRPEAWSKRQLN